MYYLILRMDKTDTPQSFIMVCGSSDKQNSGFVWILWTVAENGNRRSPDLLGAADIRSSQFLQKTAGNFDFARRRVSSHVSQRGGAGGAAFCGSGVCSLCIALFLCAQLLSHSFAGGGNGYEIYPGK